LLLLNFALAICAGSTTAVAHDIGVSEAELIEREGHRYVLSVQASPSIAHRFLPPLLPEHCGFSGNPRGIQGAGWRSFEFTCEGGLTGADHLDLPWRRDGTVLTAKWLDGTEAKRLFRNEAGTISVPMAELQAGSGSLVSAAKRYTGLGIEHILLGIDHLLFVLALLLIVNGPWMLVKTITAFTVAHSITLGLATLGFVNASPRPVEAAIALSIVFLCVEIVHAHRGRMGVTCRYPWVVAFAFGLLHGLGFAGALSEIGLPPSEIPLVLLFFNIGVEIGQLLFVASVLVLAWVINRVRIDVQMWTRVVPAYVIGTLATYWFLQRLAVIFVAA
jgi:hypothetical protein